MRAFTRRLRHDARTIFCLTLFTAAIAKAAAPPVCPPATALPKNVVCRVPLPDKVLKFERRAAGSPAQPSFFQQISDLLHLEIGKRPFERSVAFLAGVGSYSHHDPLRWIQSDLADLRSALLDRGFDEVYVAGESAVTAQLLDTYLMNLLPKELTSSDRFLFYYSGHGADLQGASGYLLFADSPQGQTDFQQTMPILNVLNWSQKIPARHAVFAFDACMSGLGFTPKDATSPDTVWLNHLSGGPSRHVITAGTADEKTYEVTPAHGNGYSVFTHAFVDQIRNGGNAGPSRGVQLLDEVFAATKAEVLRTPLPGAKSMTPRMWEIKYLLDGKEVARQGTFLFLDPKAKSDHLSPTVGAYLGARAKDDTASPDAAPSVRIFHAAGADDGAEAIAAALRGLGYAVQSAPLAADGLAINTVRVPAAMSQESAIVAAAARQAIAGKPGYELVHLTASATETAGPLEIRLGPPLRIATRPAILSGGAFTCALFAGEVYCWGFGPQALYDKVPARVELDPAGVLAVAWMRACALTTAGRVYCWGSLKPGAGTRQMLPVEMAPDRRFTDLSAGYSHACAIGYPDALVYCWGGNGDGQTGTQPASDTEWQPEPKVVATPPGVRFRSVSAGSSRTCAISEAGALYCWGRPREHAAIESPAPSLAGQQIAQVSVNRESFGVCEITSRGVAACQDVDYSQMPQVVSQPGFQAIDLVGYHVVALDKQGHLWHWGYDDVLPDYHYPTPQQLRGTFIAAGHNMPIVGLDILAMDAAGKLTVFNRVCAAGCDGRAIPWSRK